jgi:hypothetical protein
VKVGFLFIDGPDKTARVCADGLVCSLRRAMPDVPIVQFSDAETPAITAVTEVRRLPRESESMAVMRFRHQANVTGDWLFLDTDVIVQKDVRRVFRSTFHVVVTTRNWPHLKAADGFSEKMPFNTGVIFSRSQAFWREALEQLEASETHDREFMGHQQVICDLVASGRYDVAYIKGSKYNCPPYVKGGKEGGDKQLSDLLVREASIVHYKGAQRKAMMLKRIRREALCA